MRSHPATNASGGESQVAAGRPRRLLVVAAEAAVGPALQREVRSRADGRPLEIFIVAPALTSSPVKHVLGDVDEAIDEARERLSASVSELDDPDTKVVGYTGESDALLAVEDALRSFRADEILVVTHPEADQRWGEEELPAGLADQFDLPVTHIELERGRREDVPARKVEAEDDTGEPEVAARPYGIPPLSALTLAALVVGILGTVGLFVLAGIAPGGPGQMPGSARLIIALYSTLVNLAHIVGLMLFETVRFRRLPTRVFSWLALIGTPIAIVVSALIH